jgi:NTE family protein
MAEPVTALVLSGGGARAAYQVGVLQALSQLRRAALGEQAPKDNPYKIIIGTSAGAINSAALACQADRHDTAVEALAQVWANFSAEQVYRSDSLGVIRSGAQWLTMLSMGWALARFKRLKPRSLLDNTPLAELLEKLIPMERLPTMLARKHLQALAVTASSYSTGEHVTFYSAAKAVEPLVRSQRLAVPTQLIHEHLLASSAIPFIFPAKRIHHASAGGAHAAWYGDGAMRQTAPLSPAIHLGADKLLIIGAGRMNEPKNVARSTTQYPTLAQIAGHAMASIFLDALAVDIERMNRINRTLALLPESLRHTSPLRPVQSLVIAPSQRIDEMAARHVHHLPGPIRVLLAGAGVGKTGKQTQGSALASYLLFEAPFTQELMALGRADTLARQDEVAAFFGWPGTPAPQAL